MIAIDIPRERGSKQEFEDLPSAILWVQDQVSSWSSFLNGRNILPPSNVSVLLAEWQKLMETFQKLRSDKFSSSDWYAGANQDLVTIQSSIGKALIFVLEKIGAQAADAAAASVDIGGKPVDWRDADAIAGITAFRWRLELLDKVDYDVAQQAALGAQQDYIVQITAAKSDLAELQARADQLTHDASKRITEAIKKIDNHSALVDNLKGRFTAEAETLGVLFRNNAEEMGTHLRKTVDTQETNLKAWMLAHKEQVRLEAPVVLWNNRSDDHGRIATERMWWAIAAGALGLVIAVGIAIGAYELARWFFEIGGVVQPSAGKPVVAAAPVPTGTLRPTFHFELIFASAATLLWLTMYLWGMRVLIRMYMTEHHLAIDASARAAMTQTYFGLIKEGIASDADRAIVLGAIFRPVVDGMVKDDGPPIVSPSALIASLAAGSGKS